MAHESCSGDVYRGCVSLPGQTLVFSVIYTTLVFAIMRICNKATDFVAFAHVDKTAFL